MREFGVGMSIMRVRGIVIAMAAIGLALTGSGPASAASPVTCGSFLEEDGYLTADLYCPNGNGIDLGLEVTLDLRGHRLIGPGADSTGTANGYGVGVKLAPVWPSRVINGTIQGWPVGVGGNDDWDTHVDAALNDVVLVTNGTAVEANQASLDLARITLRGNRVGVHGRSQGESGSRVSMTESAFVGNEVAFQVDPRTTVNLQHNIFQRNGVGYTVTAGESDGYQALLTGNTFIRNGDGVNVAIPGTSLGSNTALRNSGWGIYAPGATDLGGNTARRNGNRPQCVGVSC